MSISELGSDVADRPTIEPHPDIDVLHLEPRCRVCRDDGVRKQVNDLLATGTSFAMVLRVIGRGDDEHAPVTINSIRTHSARHFPVQSVAKATYREILERRAQEAQIDFVNGVATALTPIAFFECIMNEAFRQLMVGDVDVSVETGLKAAEKLQTLTDAREEGADMARILADVGRIVEVVRTFVPNDKWPEVQAALRGTTASCPRVQPEEVRMVHIADEDDENCAW